MSFRCSLGFNGSLMRRECHGHSERTATGLFQIGEQRINHLHDGPGRRADRGSAPGNAVQDVGGYGGDSGGSVADCFDHGTLCLPEYVDITGESWFPLTLTFSPSFVCLYLEPHVVPVLARFTRKPLVRGPRWARNFQEADPMCVQIHSSASHAHSEYCCKAERKHTQTHTHHNLCTVFGVLQNK